ncbi:YhcN/YlaJ family sporulation lipoprotein [Microbacteriaceae bacterium 4G12]
MMGCAKQEEKKTAKKQTKTTKVSMTTFNQAPAQQAKKRIETIQGILDVKAVNSNRELYVAAKPAQYKRFQLDQLKKDMKQKIKPSSSDVKIHVSTDKKIFMLLDQLENKIEKGEADKKMVKKKLKKIKSEMNSDT